MMGPEQYRTGEIPDKSNYKGFKSVTYKKHASNTYYISDTLPRYVTERVFKYDYDTLKLNCDYVKVLKSTFYK